MFQKLDASETERRRQRNRVHVELAVPSNLAQTRLATIVAAGGRLLDESEGRWRVADPEGNEMVIVTGAWATVGRGSCFMDPARWVVSARRSTTEEPSDMSAQAVLYIIAIILLVLAALPITVPRVSLGILGAAFALAAYAWPVITA